MIKFDDINNYATCLKANLTKFPAGHHILHEFLTTPYQGLYINFGFPGCISKEKNGNSIELSYCDI